jgi:transcriptional regulator with XRE-family HTH domain
MLSPEQLKEARLKAGYTQIQAAEKLGVTRQALSRWENGRGYPDTDNLAEIGELYRIPLEQLFGTATLSQPENKDNSMFLLVLSAIAAIIPFMGFVLCYVIFKKNQRSNEYYRLINLIIICVVMFNFLSAWNVLSTWVPSEPVVIDLEE